MQILILTKKSNYSFLIPKRIKFENCYTKSYSSLENRFIKATKIHFVDCKLMQCSKRYKVDAVIRKMCFMFWEESCHVVVINSVCLNLFEAIAKKDNCLNSVKDNIIQYLILLFTVRL